MKRLLAALKRFLFPPSGAPLWIRALPYAVLGVLTLFVLVGGAYAWDYTNSPEFCGTACHTMPPEFTAYLTSPHARVDCVECHIGRGFIATRITRKAGDAKHIISLAFRDYEFPITADELRPARETCERCHFPEKFSDDSLREIRRSLDDLNSTPLSIFLVMKTGGGTKRQGLGRGIHWHIENQVLYLPRDDSEQVIPFVRVIDDSGLPTDYVDLESEIDPEDIEASALKQMDCITCHNRITHLVLTPEDTVDQLIDRGELSRDIPEIRRKAIEVYSQVFDTTEFGLRHIEGLLGYYEVAHPDFYRSNQQLVEEAVAALQDAYAKSVFPEQKSDWTSHPNNIGHQDTPGCFRCHDGKHLNDEKEAIRLECNLCHSIPVVAGPEDFLADLEISRGPEPQSHLDSNWIALHRDVFDLTCKNCHTVDDPGGTSDTSFCSNSACHGSVFTFAGFDAPGLREILLADLPPAAELLPPQDGPVTFSTVGPIFELRCSACHGENGLQGLNLMTYESILEGGSSGPVIVSGDPDSSLLVQKQIEEIPHFGQFTPDELDVVLRWIEEGALAE